MENLDVVQITLGSLVLPPEPSFHMQSLPAVLHHYTTQAGLLGILSTDALWATKIHYLNDSAEYQLALDLANQLLQRLHDRERGSRSSKRRDKIKTLLGNLRMIARMNVCVCSFSVHGDLLSQWRAYSGGVAGLSIGFRTANLLQQAEVQGFRLARCVYDAKEQRDLVEQLVNESLEMDFNTVGVRKHPTEPRSFLVLPTGGDFAMNFARLASVLKNSAFHEEGEWRLVSNAGVNAKDMKFRPGQSMLLPYTSFRLGSKKDYLESITVGPTPHATLAEDSVKSLLAHWNVVQQVTVQASEAPYRAW